MEIHDLAEQVLHGTTLADKLVDAFELTDLTPGAALMAAPATPGRPRELELVTASGRAGGRRRWSFPRPRDLQGERERGLALHAFANHELLALELMALALLRFPDAPPEWRMGLAGIMREEQQHMRLYLARMDSAGVALGEAPVAALFWNALREVSSPLDFVTHMSLTFEQANLDHAGFFARAFRAAGDIETALVLERVLSEEIGHVRHGVVWFDRMREPGSTQWQAYRSLLRPPMSPSRARGLGFERAARVAAGLEEELIEEIAVHPLDKGRAPTVHVMNLDCEAEVARGRPGHTPASATRAALLDLEQLGLMLAAVEDVVLLERRPGRSHLARLVEAGFELPRIEALPPTSELASERIAGLSPWAWTPDSRALLAPLAAQSPAGTLPPDGLDPQIYSKSTGTRLLARALEELQAGATPANADRLSRIESVGVVCRDLSQTLQAISSWLAAGETACVCKSPLAATGRGHLIVRSSSLARSEQDLLASILAAQGEVVVEPWLERRADLSISLQMDPQGLVRRSGWTRFHTDDRGRYLGTDIADPVRDLPPELRRFLMHGGRLPIWFEGVVETVTAIASAALRAAGHRGAAGIDMLVHAERETGALRLRPLVELNPRTTMGHVALALSRHVLPGRPARLWLLPPPEFHLARQGAKTIDRDGVRRISEGVVPLADPDQVTIILPVLAVGGCVAELGRRGARTHT